MANILFEFTIDAEVADVYRAITEANGIKGWWTTDTTIRPEPGSVAEFGFGPRGSLTFEVSELEENRRVVWKAVEVTPDWKSTHVTFDLESDNGGSKIVFGHRGFASEDGSFASTSFNWAHFMMSLKAYVETGQGMPACA